jgi:hypothetical protein
MRRWIASLLLPLALAAGLAAQNLGQAEGAGQAEYLGQGPYLGQGQGFGRAEQPPRLAALAWPAGDTATALVRRPPEIYPLDTIATPAAAAYGTQRLRAGWSGALLRAQRDSDNAQLDIGATATGELDTIALLNWLGVPPRPLDVLSVPPAAAYGLRLLRTAYAGAPLIQVRRSSDNALQDIGATAAGLLDTTALTNFTGSASAFIAVWYDQSGFGRHATQATPAAQPRIVNAGVVETENGRPTIRLIKANNTGLVTPAFNLATTNSGATGSFLMGAVFSRAASFGYDRLWVASADNFAIGYFGGSQTGMNVLSIAASGNVAAPTAAITASGLNVASVAFASAGYGAGVNAVRVNGGTDAVLTGNTGALNTGPVVIGNMATLINGWDGSLAELIFIAAAATVNDRTLLERSQAAFFSIAYATALPNAGVASWYDQSGNGRHAAQATPAAQPRIVNAGVVETMNGRPALRFLGAQGLRTDFFSSGAPTQFGVSATVRLDATSPEWQIFLSIQAQGDFNDFSFVTSARMLAVSNNTTSVSAFRNGPRASTPLGVATPNVVSSWFDASNHRIAAGGATPSTAGFAQSALGPSIRMGIGVNSYADMEYLTGAISEIYLVAAPLSAVDRQKLERSQGARFGITVAAISGPTRFAANDNHPVPANDNRALAFAVAAFFTRNRP